MRVLFIFITIFLSIFNGFSQSPQGFNYQAIVRDVNGNIRSNQGVQFIFEIRDASGSAVYEEVHSETLKFDSVLSYGSFDSEGTDDRSGQLSLGTTLKLYTNPESGFHLRGGVSTALSLEEKVEDFSQFGVGALLE